MATLKSITASNRAVSCIEAERVYEHMGKAFELRKLFSIIERLANAVPENDRDLDLLYLAHHGEELAGDLSEDLNISGDNLRLFSNVLTPVIVFEGKEVAHV